MRAIRRTFCHALDSTGEFHFSNRAGQGFENKIAEAVGRELNERVEYTWWPGRRNYPRNTLDTRKKVGRE